MPDSTKSQVGKLVGLSTRPNIRIVPRVLIETQILNQATECQEFLRRRTMPGRSAAMALGATRIARLRLCGSSCRARREVGLLSEEHRARRNTLAAHQLIGAEHEVTRMYAKLTFDDDE